MRRRITLLCLICIQLCFGSSRGVSAELPETVERIKTSVVVIGTYQKTRSPAFVFRGTGFAVGDGTLIATNAHVLPEQLATDKESLVVVVPRDPGQRQPRQAQVLSVDKSHDLALLKVNGTPLPALQLYEPNVKEGQVFAFTGFPLGGALGFAPVTHRAMISSLTSVALPVAAARQLDSAAVARLRGEPVPIMQLDGSAYPGSSGSPLYDLHSGAVVGIVNMVFVKDARGPLLSPPSGLSFAIPVRFLRELLRTAPTS